MPTKLSRYCEGVMEAAWLVAVVVVPVFFNIYSSRIFEPDKITLLRTLALIILGAWIIKLLDEGRARWENLEKGPSFSKFLTQTPLLGPVIALAIVYVIATIFSVSPRVSLVGSYQRLQGTYTMFSYMVVFLAIIGNLRKRSQVERVITAVVLSSLPISLYGILQKYRIDPVPWGGNVSNRIASNMGNSIFVAAYLIMAVPLVFGRIVQSFGAILKEEQRVVVHIVRATLYVFIFAVDLVAIYMSGSRGPFLGLLAGFFFMFLLLFLNWQKRWMMLTTIGIAGGMAVFLLLLSIPNGPLSGLRDAPLIGRYSKVFDTEDRTSQVRILIWEGAWDLVRPHAPINYPDGSTDKVNFLRPLVGYGPEGMYVAYNQFYPSELGRVEKRNASPDRSHNETWDSLVTTGLLGFAAYLLLFVSVLYYGLKWLGLIHTGKQRNVFLAFVVIGGAAGAIGLTVWQGVEFFGVGLPFGVIMGAIGYLTVFALFASTMFDKSKIGPDAVIMIMLLAAIVAHFVEINFGIAIASTRTHFFVYAALLFVMGYVLPRQSAATEALPISDGRELVEPDVPAKKSTSKRRKVAHDQPVGAGRYPAWVPAAVVGSAIVSVILVSMGYDFISNSARATSAFTIIGNSMTRLPNRDNALSYGVLAMVLTTWLSGVLLVTAENKEAKDASSWWRALGLTAGVSAAVILLFWLWHAGSLAALASLVPSTTTEVLTQINSLGGLLTSFYFYLFMIIFGVAAFLPSGWPSRAPGASAIGAFLAPVVVLVVVLLVYVTNLQVIHSDIAFKMADPFTKSRQWQVATLLYQRALQLTPNEDHYYLFLGRSYLEQAKISQDAEEQADLVQQAQDDLKKAQRINPLNTDHTANLGRLLSWWAGMAGDATVRVERGEEASRYYSLAVKLSPNNPTLWGEWAILLLDVLRQPDAALEKLNHAVELDDQYAFTQGLLGDYYHSQGRSLVDVDAKREALETAAGYYERAFDVTKSSEASSRASYLVSLGNTYIELANLDPENIDDAIVEKALDAYLRALDAGPAQADVWKIDQTIARLYSTLGDKTSALEYANLALAAAPEASKETVQKLIEQINTINSTP